MKIDQGKYIEKSLPNESTLTTNFHTWLKHLN